MASASPRRDARCLGWLTPWAAPAPLGTGALPSPLGSTMPMESIGSSFSVDADTAADDAALEAELLAEAEPSPPASPSLDDTDARLNSMQSELDDARKFLD